MNFTKIHQSTQPYSRHSTVLQVNTLPIVPTLMSFLANDPLVDKYDMSSIQSIICATSSLSVSLENAVKKRLKLEKIFKGYTMTEMMSTCHNRSSEDKPGSVGRLFYGMSAKVSSRIIFFLKIRAGLWPLGGPSPSPHKIIFDWFQKDILLQNWWKFLQS